MRVLVLDNYDSFTYNLVQYLGELGSEVEVVRNDHATTDELLVRGYDRVIVSPGPCTPNEAGICLDLIEPAGLPDRPWYRHVIYAPGLYTGYGVKTIPGVREAVDAGNYARAAEQAAVVIRALQRATKTLEGS